MIDTMGQIIFKIWYMVAVLPFFIFLEVNEKFAAYLKKKDIYAHWDKWHSLLVVLIVLVVGLWMNGYR